jgi:hypothetical protein
VVVVGAAVVVGAVVGGAAVVVGPATGGWVLVAPKVEDASLVMVVPAVAGAWALTGPAVVVGPPRARGPVSGVVVVRLGAVVGAGLRVGWVGTAGGRARAGARLGGDGWGSRVAEATRAARTPVVSPKATSMSRQGHRELVRCRGGGVDMGMSRFDGNVKADMAHFLGALPGRIPLRRWPCSPRAASSTGRT